jgi:hypothetical protein
MGLPVWRTPELAIELRLSNLLPLPPVDVLRCAEPVGVASEDLEAERRFGFSYWCRR